MQRKMVLYELLDWDGADGRSNRPSGAVTASPEVAKAWRRQASGNSVRELRGTLIQSLDDMAQVRLAADRARALAKLTPRDREVLGVADDPQAAAASDGNLLLAQTQAAAFARAAKIMAETDEERGSGDAKVRFAHLIRMCEIGAAHAGEWPADKTGRWLGYVQGCLAARGLLDVDAERDLTRGDFRTAYALLGLEAPATIELAEGAAR